MLNRLHAVWAIGAASMEARHEPPERRLFKTINAKKVVLLQDLNLQPLVYRSSAIPKHLN